MARYTGPVCRICRREGVKLFFKADRCYTEKCPMNKHAYGPGEHGQGRKKVSEYGVQLREKQKTKRMYGVLERQFRKYFATAERAKGMTGENLLSYLERRLDNVVYRLGLAGSRREARQLVRHGHFQVNGRKVNIPSFQVRVADRVAVRDKSREVPRLKELAEATKGRQTPGWLEAEAEAMAGRVVRLPERADVDAAIQERLIVELYSR